TPESCAQSHYTVCRLPRPQRPVSPQRPLSSVSIYYGRPRSPAATVGGSQPLLSAFYHVLFTPSTSKDCDHSSCRGRLSLSWGGAPVRSEPNAKSIAATVRHKVSRYET